MTRVKTDTKAAGRAAEGRREQITHAALEVLGQEGSRGLTHRAVDSRAGAPPGTTTNFFPTRSALLGAALRRHVELDTPPSSELVEVEGLELDDEQAKELILGALDHLLRADARSLLTARFELVLESTRRPELHAEFELARERFVNLAQSLLRARGCARSRPHAVQLAATLDGVLVDQLLGTAGALGRQDIEDLVERQLATC